MWVEVGHFASAREAGEHALVLVAAGIDCQLAPGGGTTRLLVETSTETRALQELAAYDAENQTVRQRIPEVLPLQEGQTGVLAYWCVLVFFYSASSRHAFGTDWLAAGAAQSRLILDGEWERIVTALTLHADFGHLLSNLIAGSLFGFFVSQMLGSGLGWLLILVAGGAGNAINALLQPASHTSIGSSTVIFGAVGLLAVVALNFRSRWPSGLRRWVPLAAGVMLLAFLGIEGERIDVWAHIAGFAAGGLLGGGILLLGVGVVPIWANLTFAIGALAILIGSWCVALLRFGA